MSPKVTLLSPPPPPLLTKNFDVLGNEDDDK